VIALSLAAQAWPPSNEAPRPVSIVLTTPGVGQKTVASLSQRNSRGCGLPTIETDSQAFSDDVVRSPYTIQRPTMFATTTPNARTIITDSATANSTRSFRLSAAAALAAQWPQMILTE
jgi:hypothetical protein